MEVYYDLSRLIERSAALYPSGIDRVDLRYALWTRSQASAWVGLMQHPDGVGMVDPAYVNDLLCGLRGRWIERGDLGAGSPPKAVEKPRNWALETKLSVLEKAARVGLLQRLEGRALFEWPFYANPALSRRLLNHGRKVSPTVDSFSSEALYWNIGHNFRFEKAAAQIGPAFTGRSVVFLHDVIPLLYLETQRATASRHFGLFCEWVDRLRSRLIVSSQSTVADVGELRQRGIHLFGSQLEYLIQLSLPVESTFADSSSEEASVVEDPYFIILGTWESRKNFELLLDVWERLAAAGRRRIILKWVGRRIRLSAQTAERLERLKADGWVEELGVLPDLEIRKLFSSARALLFPSLAEGWGLPLAEALSAGLPAIASDSLICREVSQGLAEYKDPADVEAWHMLVAEYAEPHSASRLRQIERLNSFRPSLWDPYFEQLSALL